MISVCILVQHDYAFDIRVRRKAEALVAAGYSVDAFALRGSHPQKTYTLAGVNVYTLSLGKKRGSLLRYAFEYIAFFLWALGQVTVRMPSRRYAVVDVNTLPDFLVFAAIFAKWMGAKIVLDMHEIAPEFYMSKYGKSRASWYVRTVTFLEKISFSFADHVLTINEPIQELLASRGLPKAKSTIITNAADESRFATSRAHSTGMPDSHNAFVFMYHGTITKIYGLDIAVEAFALAHTEMPKAEFWIVGPGDQATALAALAEQRAVGSKVKFFGVVPPAEITAFLDKCDAGVLPMRSDVFLDYASPNKLAEFIIKGKPVLMSRLRAVRHYFGEHSLAYFQPNDPEDLARQMVRVYRDESLRAQLANRAKKEYSFIRWDIMKQRYLALIQQLIGTAPCEAVPSQIAR